MRNSDLLSSEVLEHFRRETDRLYNETDKAILANFGGTGFGDIALVPGPWLKHPKGIRDVEEWYVSTVARRDYVYAIFERQCEIALANLQAIHGVVGNRVAAVLVTGTDFGTQRGPFLSNRTYQTTVPTLSQTAQRLDSYPYHVEKLYPFLRFCPQSDARLYRGRFRHSQSGAILCRRYGPPGTQVRNMGMH